MFRLGPFDFLNLDPAPPALDVELEFKRRPGVDGWTVIELGIRGQPFLLRSVTDAANGSHAFQLYVAYTALKLEPEPQPLMWKGIDYSTVGYGVIVMNVKPLRLGDVILTSGGFWPGGSGWLECEWELMPVFVGEGGN